jgi:hypothetical protein
MDNTTIGYNKMGVEWIEFKKRLKRIQDSEKDGDDDKCKRKQGFVRTAESEGY